MTLEQFSEKITSALKQHFGGEYCIRTLEVKKNNGVRLHGLSILKQDDPNRIAPTIYMEDFYERYIGGIPLAETVREIIRTYEAHTVKEDISMEFFRDYEKVRDRIVYKLINYEMNKGLLQEIPHILYLDLAVVFYYYMENETFGAASILIYNVHIKNWAVSRERLIADAKYNTPRVLGYRLANMEDIMRELIRKDLWDRISQKKNDGRQKEKDSLEKLTDQMVECFLDGRAETQMYVLSNRSSMNGAACILYPNVLKEFAERIGSDLYILPSSIHEVILIKDQGIEDAEGLRNMVKDVNRTQLDPEEILSDQVYYYSRENGKVQLCKYKTNVK